MEHTDSVRSPRRRERQQISSMQIVFAAILAIGLLLVINFSGRIARGQQMEMARERLQATLTVLQAQQIELRKARDYAASDASIEEWAHTEGKMVREGEMLVVPIPAVTILATFGDLFELRDYRMPELATSGEAITVTFWWGVASTPPGDYEMAVFLTDPTTGAVAVQADEPPLNGTAPTSTWRPGDLLEDSHRLVLPSTLKPGIYQLGIKLYAATDQQPLSVQMAQDDPGVVSSFARLGTLRVVSSEHTPEEHKPNWHLWWNLFFDGDPPF